MNQRINTSMNGADTDGEWHHLAYVKKVNRAESEMAITAIFQDGVPIVSSPGCDLTCWANGAEGDVQWADATIADVVPITVAGIGGEASGGSSNNGLMDDFAMWNESLSTERIVGLSQGGGVIPIPGSEIVGDFNSDGVINLDDFMIIVDNFNARFGIEAAFFNGDMDGDFRINLKDFLAFRELFENSAGAAAASVPEPSSMALLGGLLLGLCRRRRGVSHV